MPEIHEKLIPCARCEEEKRIIELNGKMTVIDCKPAGTKDGIPQCRIRWTVKPLP